MRRKQKEETPVVKRALQYVRARWPNGFWWRANSGGNKTGRKHNSEKLSDIVGHTNMGFAAFIEVKTATGRLTREQLAFLVKRQEQGCVTGVYVDNTLYSLGQIPAENMPPKQRSV